MRFPFWFVWRSAGEDNKQRWYSLARLKETLRRWRAQRVFYNKR
jgi:hypothetical protein